MSKQFKTYNDLNKAYDNGPVVLGNVHYCPVCDKPYKSLKAAEKHITERTCYSLCDLFKNTMYEITAYGLYKDLLDGLYTGRRTPNIVSFRKSNNYSSIMRFVLFCNLQSIKDIRDLYIEWLNQYENCKHINQLMAAGVKESNLRKFYLFLHRYSLIESEKFYNENKKQLMEDGQFFIRSLEKAKVGLKFLLEQPDFDFDKRMESLELEYQVRFTDWSNDVVGGV